MNRKLYKNTLHTSTRTEIRFTLNEERSTLDVHHTAQVKGMPGMVPTETAPFKLDPDEKPAAYEPFLVTSPLDRKLPFAPGVEAPFKRADAMDSLFLQEKRGAGAGDLVRAGTVEDDITVTRNLVMAMLDLLHQEVQGPGDRFGIQLQGQRMPDVYHRDGITGIHALLQFIHGDLRHPEVSQEFLPMEKLVRNKSGQADPEDREEPASGLIKEQRKSLELIAEERAQSGAQSRPDQRPGCIVEEERRGTQAHNSS